MTSLLHKPLLISDKAGLVLQRYQSAPQSRKAWHTLVNSAPASAQRLTHTVSKTRRHQRFIYRPALSPEPPSSCLSLQHQQAGVLSPSHPLSQQHFSISLIVGLVRVLAKGGKGGKESRRWRRRGRYHSQQPLVTKTFRKKMSHILSFLPPCLTPDSSHLKSTGLMEKIEREGEKVPGHTSCDPQASAVLPRAVTPSPLNTCGTTLSLTMQNSP